MTTLSFEVPDGLAARVRAAAGDNPDAWFEKTIEHILALQVIDRFDPADIAAFAARGEDRAKGPDVEDTREAIQARLDEIQARMHAA